jgi:hypothetical protein
VGIIEKIAVDVATLERLEANARAHGRTLEQEAAETLRAATGVPSRADVIAHMDEIAAMTPKGIKQTDSVLLLREDRDR